MLPALNVVNDVLFTGETTLGDRYFDWLTQFHVYLDRIAPSGANAGLVVDAKLSALVDCSGGSDDGFKHSDVNAVVNAWVYHGLTSLGKLGRWLNKTGEADRLDAAAGALKAAFNALLIDGDGRVCDGVCERTPHTSVHSSFYALAFGLVADDNVGGVWRYIVDRVQRSPVGVPCGSYPVQFLLQALYANESDRGAQALGVLTSAKKHSWLAMMDDHSATCTMECWSEDELRSLTFSHVWSSSPNFVIPWLLFGITPLAPGWAKLSIKPQPGTLTHGEYTMPTIRGPVTAAFNQSFAAGGAVRSFDLAVLVPGGATARAHVPYPPDGCVTVDGLRTRAAAAPQRARASVPAHAWAEVGAGAHTIRWCR